MLLALRKYRERGHQKHVVFKSAANRFAANMIACRRHLAGKARHLQRYVEGARRTFPCTNHSLGSLAVPRASADAFNSSQAPAFCEAMP